MSVHVSMEDGVLLTRFTDVVTLQDLFELAARVAAIEDGGQPAPDRLTDMTSATGIEISFSDVLELAKRRAQRKLAAPIRSAIVVSNAAHRGFARMYQTLNDHPDVTIEIFGDFESARAWLSGDAERVTRGADAVSRAELQSESSAKRSSSQ